MFQTWSMLSLTASQSRELLTKNSALFWCGSDLIVVIYFLLQMLAEAEAVPVSPPHSGEISGMSWLVWIYHLEEAEWCMSSQTQWFLLAGSSPAASPGSEYQHCTFHGCHQELYRVTQLFLHRRGGTDVAAGLLINDQKSVAKVSGLQSRVRQLLKWIFRKIISHLWGL